MVTMSRPAVERNQPPAGPFVVINAVMRGLLTSPLHSLAGDRLALLCYSGRKSGRSFRTPVGVHDVDGTLVTLTSSGWRHNFRGGAPVTLRRNGRDLPMTATLVDDPGQVAGFYATLIERLGHDRAGRRLGVRINVDRVPTREELADAARRSGLSVVCYQDRTS